MIIGTAGHVDHGKTALVKALTGVDTDRLAEEKRRGITIDLGFAPLRLNGAPAIGVVDVPGHEAFVRNMLAGATGVDLALLVIAADEGVMPQTREHLAILTLLGVRHGVIALTKSDLADQEWLDLVSDDARAAVASTPLADAEIIPTSVTTGAGLTRLRAAIASAADALPTRDAEDLFRLPIDRAFSVKGTGTVVTGTVWSGTLATDHLVRVLPGGRSIRVRGIESHGISSPAARAGSRAAVALAGVDKLEVGRGAVLLGDGDWRESRAILAEVMLLDDAPRALGARTRVRFHLGTAEVGARVLTTGGALEPGARKQARVMLDSPIVARAGDRFVLRSTSPVATIGGGVVNDPTPVHRRPRPWLTTAQAPGERVSRAVESAGASGVAIASLTVRTGATPAELVRLLARLPANVCRVGERLYSRALLGALGVRLCALVDSHLALHPLEPGAPLGAVRAQAGAEPAVLDRLIAERVAEGELEVRGALISRTGWNPVLTDAQRATEHALVKELERAGREPPSVSELESRFGDSTVPLLRNLERRSDVIEVESGRYYNRRTLEDMVSALRCEMRAGDEYGPAELREILGVTRKYLIPFLEYCDRVGVTERRSAGRVINDRVK